MRAAEFIKRVVPDGGFYCVVWDAERLDRSGKPFFNNAGFRGLDALQERVEALVEHGRNVFFAPASMLMRDPTNRFVEIKRDANNVRSCRSFWVDLDVRAPHKADAAYASVRDAWSAVQGWVAQHRLPRPSILVRSGWGLHVYWVLDAPITRDEWVPLAKALRASGVAAGVKADWSVCSQPHQIMRLPGTINYKSRAEPRPVQALSVGPDVPLADFAQALSAFSTGREAAAHRAAATDRAAWEGLRFSAERAAAVCGVLREIAQTHGANASEPLWVASLQFLAHCHDGPALVHEWSRGHPQYTHAETEKKWQHVRETFEHPPTCARLGALSGGAHCAACPLNGKVASPITEARSDDDLPPGYHRGANAIYRTVETDEGEARPVLAFPALIRNLQLAEIAAEHGVLRELSFEVSVGRAGWEFFRSDITELAPGVVTDLGRRLIAAGVNVSNPRVFAIVKDTMLDWATYLRQRKLAVARVDHRMFGWVEGAHGRDGFVFGTKFFRRDGTSEEIVPVLPAAMAARFRPCGDIGPWQDFVRLMWERGGSPDLQIAVAASLAAPLVSLSQVRGLVVNLHSPESGSGKTTSLMAAQAVWGHPTEGAMAVDDTENAVAHVLGTLRHLPVIWDEVRSRGDGSRLAQLVFRVAQGKERARLTAAASLMQSGTWETLVAVGSNVPLEDVMEQAAQETLAGVNRVFSLRVPRLPSAREAYSWPDLSRNYGRAGERYLAWVTAHLPAVEQMMDATRRKVVERLGADPNERFWREFMVIVVTAMWAADKAGVMRFPVQAVWNRLVEAVLDMRRGRVVLDPSHVEAPSYDETDTARAARLLHEFVIDQAAHIIRTTEMDGGKDRMVVVLNDKLVRAPLKGQIVENAQRLVVRARSFLLWAQERRYGRRSVEKGMTDLFGPQTRVALGRGTVLSTPADSAWVVDLQSEAGASLRELVKTCG